MRSDLRLGTVSPEEVTLVIEGLKDPGGLTGASGGRALLAHAPPG